MGEPIARYLIDCGVRVVGVDASPSMIERCRARFPDSEWLVADSASWSSTGASKAFWRGTASSTWAWRINARCFPVLPPMPGAALMFTSGLAEGEAIGSCCEEPLYHASLGPAEYEQLLTTNGYVVRAYVAEDPRCGKHTVWLGPGNSRRARFRVCAAQAERGDVGRLRVDVGKIAGKTSDEVFVEEELHGPAGARRTRRLRRLERARTAPCRCSG